MLAWSRPLLPRLHGEIERLESFRDCVLIAGMFDPESQYGKLSTQAHAPAGPRSFPGGEGTLTRAASYHGVLRATRPPPMKTSELASHVTGKAVLPKAQAGRVADAVFSALGDVLASDESVAILGPGTFRTEACTARQGRNPRTGGE